MSKKLPVDGFEWVEDLSTIDEDFIKKIMMKIVIQDISLKQTLNIQKNYILYTVIYHFYQKEWKLINVKS